LTPIYLDEEDARHFHLEHKQACDKFDGKWYPFFKKWCDEYFYLSHRNEARGIGGIFFDDVSDRNRDTLLSFLETCGAAFCSGYFPIVWEKHFAPFNEFNKLWQQLRRGRYVEFNLIWDRGTKFGLHTPNSRIESILMSLPLTARWEYMHIPEEGSPEAKLLQVLKHPKDWIQ
jgi:coproporphyrinogen III oxidase